MIIAKTPKLRRGYEFYRGGTPALPISLCTVQLREFFDFPAKAKEIQFVARDQPSRDSVSVVWDDCGQWPWIPPGYRAEGEILNIQLATEFTIRNLIGRGPAYVELYYWD